MTQKKYQQIKIIITIIIAVIFSQSIIAKNFFIPVITLLVSSLILLELRKRVKEVIADERDMDLAGKSALLSIQIFSWIAVISMFFLYSIRDQNPAFEPIALTLAFSTCALMFSYTLVFVYKTRINK